ncbi:MAG TPA: carboxylate-amine ligase [Aggregatilineales bacterium]|nr:carboxylate-amine ligase [Aggregatilineales bacterium]
MYNPPLTLGVEEEYMLVDATTRALTSGVSDMLAAGQAVLGDQVKAEFMQSQLEVGTKVCKTVAHVRDEITLLRHTLSEIAATQGKAIAAAGTHPFSRWQDQEITRAERYEDLQADMQDVARRLLIFGMHVHLGFGESDQARALTIDILNQIRYFLPHILTISTSSPFWHGRNTGLKSYRTILFESLPRTGIPPIFTSFEEYDRLVALFGKVGVLGKSGKDATKLWWDARPNPRIGTLEIRVADICTTVDEMVCVAAVIQALVAKLVKLRLNNQSWRLYRSELIQENKWRASRFGIDGTLVDFGIEEAVPVRALWGEILNLVDDVVDELGSRREVEYVQTILDRGTSADRQLATYHMAMAAGSTEAEALFKVADQLVRETRAEPNLA